jgi:hypothetical protein
MTGPVAGPWILVAGMHRSGTSAVSRLAAGLGLGGVAGDDTVEWAASNPDHAESLTLTTFDDDVLRAAGGSWDGPPDPQALGPDVVDRETAVAALNRAFPEPGPTVWKDPRLCLLLPAWRAVLADRIALVLVWRRPAAVAASLAGRDGMATPDALALWERYNAAALRGAGGLPVHVLAYESMVADPGRAAGELARWLDGLGDGFRPATGFDLEAAASRVAPDLDHAPVDDVALLPEQERLLDQLGRLVGPHRSFAAGPTGPESPWTTALLRYRRDRSEPLTRLAEVGHELELERRALAEARRRLNDVSTAWRMTGPLRSVLGGRRRDPSP